MQSLERQKTRFLIESVGNADLYKPLPSKVVKTHV